MQLAGLSYLSAPQVTGHPHALPGAPEKKPPLAEVQPILDARRPETQLGRNSPRTFYFAVQNEPDPVAHNPPPSIMQIKISQMLQDQVVGEQLDKDDVVSRKPANADDASKAEPAHNTPESAQAETAGVTEPSEASTRAEAPREPLPFQKAARKRIAPEKPAIEKAAPVPERAPMNMPVKAVDPASVNPQINASMAPAGYEEAASISRTDVLSTLP